MALHWYIVSLQYTALEIKSLYIMYSIVVQRAKGGRWRDALFTTADEQWLVTSEK